MDRTDYAFPFRIDATSHQGAQTNYEAHIDQMIRQVLLTAPGERADLPEFGCGLRQLIFALHSHALDATTTILVQQALNQWLANQIQVQNVQVGPPEAGDDSQLLIEIDYILLQTRSNKKITVLVS